LRRYFQARGPADLSGAWLILKLTALLLLLDWIPIWYLGPTLVVLAGLGLVFPDLLRTPALWAGITLLVAVRVIRLWPVVDNHHYLLAYWCLATFIALCLPDPQKALAASARWVLAFVFLWAVLWKGILSPDYRDGRFFTVRLMTDDRFKEQIELFSGLTQEDILRNREYLAPPLLNQAEGRPEERAAFRTSPRFSRWVTILTWGTLLFEAVLALAFLLPPGRRSLALRHGLLLVFCLGTFAIAPVSVFGWLFVLMGLAQVPPERRTLRAIYVAAWFLIVFLTEIPWAQLLVRLASAISA
jgi:hypothetical protein